MLDNALFSLSFIANRTDLMPFFTISVGFVITISVLIIFNGLADQFSSDFLLQFSLKICRLSLNFLYTIQMHVNSERITYRFFITCFQYKQYK